MTSTMRLVAALVVVIAAAGAYLAVGSSDDAADTASRTTETTAAPSAPAPTPAPTAAEDEADAPAPAAGPAAKPGEYVEYSDAALASAEGTRILFFHASWCTQCRELEETIRSEGLPDGVTVLKVDYDSRQDLRERYGVTLQTTVVKVDADGEAIESFVPYDDPTIERVLAELA